MIFGVIDIGSNSIKLLIAESASSLAARYETTWETRIGTGLGSKEPRLTRSAITNGVQAVKELVEQAEAYQPESFFVVGTSALRDAANRDEFINELWKATGQRLRVLSGDEEAAYIAHGIMADPQLAEHKELCLVDLGGGSMEAIHIRYGRIVKKVSLPVGAVRLSEACLASATAPMSSEEMRQITWRVQDVIQRSSFTFPEGEYTLAGTGGVLNVARRVRAAWLGSTFDDVGNTLSLNFLEYLFLELASMRSAERSRLPAMPPERADIMPAGLLVLITVLRLANARSYLHSLHNLRYGVAACVHKHLAEEGILSSEIIVPM